MMGRQNNDQGPLFYEFRLDEAVPDDHLVRKINAVLDLSWVHAELAPHYPTVGRPSVDPVLMIRMLIIGYVFALRSERLLCRELHVNLAFAGSASLALSTRSLIIRHSRVPAMNASATAASFARYLSVWSRLVSQPISLAEKGLPWMRA